MDEFEQAFVSPPVDVGELTVTLCKQLEWSRCTSSRGVNGTVRSRDQTAGPGALSCGATRFETRFPVRTTHQPVDTTPADRTLSTDSGIST